MIVLDRFNLHYTEMSSNYSESQLVNASQT